MFRQLALVTTCASFAMTAAFAATASASGPAPVTPAWVARNAQALLKAIAQFAPEFASRVGQPGYDEKSADLKPGVEQRQRSALETARAELQKEFDTEKDANVKQDLAILIKSADRRIDTSKLDEKYLLPYSDVGELIFQGEFLLLQDQIAPERRAKALVS